MLWTGGIQLYGNHSYYAIKGEEYFAEKAWTYRVQVDKAESRRTDKFIESARFSIPTVKLHWLAILSKDWLLYDTLPAIAALIPLILTMFWVFWAIVVTNLVVYDFHCLVVFDNSSRRTTDATFIDRTAYGLNSLSDRMDWTLMGNKVFLFSYIFGFGDNNEGALIFYPAWGAISLEGSYDILSHICTPLADVIRSHQAVSIVKGLSVFLYFDVAISIVLKATKRLTAFLRPVRVTRN